MTEHEAGPLDDKPEALHAANALLRKRREMRRMYSATPIRSGLCSHCGAFGSLWHQTDSCESCFREHEAPQPITFVPWRTKMFTCKYCEAKSDERMYYASFLGESGDFACPACFAAGKVKPGNGKLLPGWDDAITAKARSSFANAAWMVTIWFLAMTGLCFIGWHGMRWVGEFCFWLGGKL